MVHGWRNQIDPIRVVGAVIAVVGISMVAGAAFDRSAQATQPNPEHQVTLCHRSDSVSNPYQELTVDVASVLGNAGHDGHDGPVFTPDVAKHEQWGDIIPPFDFGPGERYPGQNWTTEGQAIAAAGCASPTTSTTTTAPVSTTTAPGSTTTTTVAGSTTTIAESTTTTVAASTTTTVDDEGATTTTIAPTTTTIAPPATTTTVHVEGTTGTTITTTTTRMAPATTPTTRNDVEGTEVTTPPTTGPETHQGLPFSGSGAAPLVAVGLGLIGIGSALVYSRRRAQNS